MSQRRIAVDVFGDVRFRGRVERVLRAAREREAGDEASAPVWVGERGSDAQLARELLTRLEGRLLGRDDLTLGEMERWLRLQLKVSQLEQFERACELTRLR